MNAEQLKRYFENGNINFLIGSGLSCPYLRTLGKIETWLSCMEAVKKENRKCVLASIYGKFFKDVIRPNLTCYKKGDEYDSVLRNYEKFISIIHRLVVLRNSAYGLSKQVNIFTTNIDDFFETAFEKSGVEWNAGFSGLINPEFNENNFGKSYNVSSRIFSRKNELPLFNLMKIHGSINWKSSGKSSREIYFDASLRMVENVASEFDKIDHNALCEVNATDKIKDIDSKADPISKKDDNYEAFLKAYEELVIINPNKKKFSTTVLDSRFYELMRLYSNALEKPNSVLFVHGFSFADEHLAQMTMRAADSNPTLQVFVFAFKKDEISSIEKNLHLSGCQSKNNNVQIVTFDWELKFEAINSLYESVLKIVEPMIEK